MAVVVQVSGDNFDAEFLNISRSLPYFRYVAVDAEFPGFLRPTPRSAAEVTRYSDLKFNVDSTKIIQLGFTLFDPHGTSPCASELSWQFNFRGFDAATDPHVPSSIRLLERSGIDFESIRTKGIDATVFAHRLRELLCRRCGRINWVTFHGLYDIAYMIKLVTGGSPLPSTLPEFARTAAGMLGSIYDIKYIARFCGGISDEKLGLARMAATLDVLVSDGDQHQAGYDSLVTARLFSCVRRVYRFDEWLYKGYLYGIESQRIAQESLPRSSSCCSWMVIMSPPHPLWRVQVSLSYM